MGTSEEPGGVTPPVGALPELTCDTFFRGRVSIRQPKRGYRFSIDAPLLADFLPVCAGAALEVGCGSGVVSLLALSRSRMAAVTALEIQPDLAGLAWRNAEENGLSSRLRVLCGDFRERYREFAPLDLLFSNPPYLSLDRGRPSADPQVRQAKFEMTLRLDELVRRTAAILVPGGFFVLIVPWSRGDEVLRTAGAAGLQLSRRRAVHPYAGRPPNRVLLELRRGPAWPIERPPLIIFHSHGVYTEEMERIFAGMD
jgi:tRNA1Val (adenine37-N6)-methyltransferase